MRDAFKLLRLITEAFPPPVSAHHQLIVEKDTLILVLFLSDSTWQSFRLDDVDLDKAPERIVADVISAMTTRVEGGRRC